MEHLNMEAMRKVMPEKASLIDEIFGYTLHGNSKPTYNLTTKELSDSVTHIFTLKNESWYPDVMKSGRQYDGAFYHPSYLTERNKVIKSCETGFEIQIKVYYYYDNKYFENKGKFCFVEDLDISVLQSIKYMIGDMPYWKWLNNKREKDRLYAQMEEKSNALEKENEELREKLATIQELLSK